MSRCQLTWKLLQAAMLKLSGTARQWASLQLCLKHQRHQKAAAAAVAGLPVQGLALN
jgi:hypothetical protein